MMVTAISAVRTAWVVVNLVLSTLFAATSVLVATYLFRVNHPLIYDRIPRLWARWQLWAAAVHVHVEGLEWIRPDRPQVIVSNHESWYDVFALMATVPKRYRLVAKAELRKIPLFGPACRAVGNVWVDRSDHESAVRSLDAAAELLRSDSSAVIIFPEGTRSGDGKLQPLKKGAFVMALHTGAEVVPAGITGSREIHRKGGWTIRSGDITLRFGEPIEADGGPGASSDHLRAIARSKIAALRH